MFTSSQLAAFYRELRAVRMLTVYIDCRTSDPAARRGCRLRLEHQLDRCRSDAGPTEARQLERCIAHLDRALNVLDGTVSASWVAFVTPDGIREAHWLPTSPPGLARWMPGPFVSPYIRALKQATPVLVAVADARKASLYRYQFDRLERMKVFWAHHPMAPVEHMGQPPRTGFHGGTRGATGRDAAQRGHLHGRDRMIAELAEAAEPFAHSQAWFVVGGTRQIGAQVVEAFARHAPGRVLYVPGVDIHAARAQIAEAARTGASLLRNSVDERRVGAVVELAQRGGLGTIGLAPTTEALSKASVHDVYVTRRFIDRDDAVAEAAIRRAFDQDAIVEEVAGIAADRIGAEGIVAGLRFRAHAAAPAYV